MPSLRHRRLAFAVLLVGLLVSQTASAQQPPETPFLRIEPGMHTDQVRRIAAFADGQTVATIAGDKTLRLWSADGSLLRTLRPPIADGPEGSLRALALSTERRMAAAAGFTGAWARDQVYVYLFPLDQDRMRRLPTGVRAEVTALAFAPGGNRLAIGFGKPVIQIYDFTTEMLVPFASLGLRGAVASLAFDAAGNLAVADDDGQVHLFDPQMRPLRPARRLPEGGLPGDLAFSPDGRLLAVGVANMPVVRLLDARTLEPRGTPALPRNLGMQRQNLAAVGWLRTPTGQQLHAAGYVLDQAGDNVALRWDALNAPPAAAIPLGRDSVFSLAPLPGERMAFASGEPSWGIYGGYGRLELRLDRQGGDFRSIGVGQFRLHSDHTEFGVFPETGAASFRVSDDGMIVEFGMARGGRDVLRFDVTQRTLSPVRPASRLEPSVGATLLLYDWMNGGSPHLGPQRLQLDPGEIARSAAVLPGGGFLLGSDTSLRRFDRNGRLVDQVSAAATVWGVQVAGDGRQAVVALGDGTIRWHSLDPDRHLAERAALFVHRDGRRWILWTPEGFFDHADSGGQDLAGYHLNRRANEYAEWVNFAQLYRVFYAEDLVRARLAFGDENPLRDRLAAIGDVRALLHRLPPPLVALVAVCHPTRPGGDETCSDFGRGVAVTRGLTRLRESARLTQPRMDGAGTAPTATVVELPAGITQIRLRAQVTDRGGGIGQTDLLVNGRNIARNTLSRGLGRPVTMVPTTSPLDAMQKDSGAGMTEYSRVFDVDPGVSTIQLRVFDRGNETFGQSAQLELRATNPAPAPMLPTLHILAVGVNDYDRAGLRSLDSAVSDTHEIVKLIGRGLERDYRINPIVLTDRDAGRVAIEAAFGRLEREARPEDTVLIYLAGHGTNQGDSYFFIPYIDHTVDEAGAVALALDDRRLVELWASLKARNSLLMIDTCHAGAFNMEFAGKLQNETGRLVLAAASAQQLAADRVPGTVNGPFAIAVLEALRGKTQRRRVSGDIDQLALGYHVKERVPELARQAHVEQRVSFRLSTGEMPSPFPLSRAAP